jgi:hypothetical protein
MSGAASVNPPVETPTSPPAANTPEARSDTGEIKNLATAPLTGTQKDSTGAQTEKPTDAKPTAPDTYTFTAPEGRTLDPKLIEQATPIFRELGLDQAAAQRLVDFYNQTVGDRAKAVEETVSAMREGWRGEIKSDPEMGPKFETMKTDIGRFKDQLFAGDKSARDKFDAAMDLTGAGDNPAIVRAWWKAAQLSAEGTHVSGSPNSQAPAKPGESARPSLAAAMYPTLPH